jgi:hypothetical protein
VTGGFPADRLRREMHRRINDGWDVRHRDGRSLVMVHGVDPPWWRMLLEVPMIFFGGVAIPSVTVELHVWIDDEGRLWRSTEGEVARGWRRRFAWWVPDGADDRA